MLCLNLNGKEYTTDENGRIELVGVKDGSYEIWETQPANGFKSLDMHIEIDLNDGKIIHYYYDYDDGDDHYYGIGDNYGKYGGDDSRDLVRIEENEIYVTNEPNKIVIHKVDEEGNPLPGAVFEFDR